MMHLGLNLTHSAMFSNGDYGNGQVQGPEHTLPSRTRDGATVDSSLYTQSFDALGPATTRLTAVRPIQNALSARGAFVVLIEGHQDECIKWNGYKHTIGGKYYPEKCYGRDRFCHPEGIFIPVAVDETMTLRVIDGFNRIGDWVNFGFVPNDLLNSVAWAYLESGLDSVTMYR